MWTPDQVLENPGEPNLCPTGGGGLALVPSCLEHVSQLTDNLKPKSHSIPRKETRKTHTNVQTLRIMQDASVQIARITCNLY